MVEKVQQSPLGGCYGASIGIRGRSMSDDFATHCVFLGSEFKCEEIGGTNGSTGCTNVGERELAHE